MIAGESGGVGRDSWGLWGGHVHTTIFKMDSRQNLLHGTWSSAHCYLPAWMGGEFGREWTRVYGWLSPCAVHQKLSQHCSLAIPQYKIKSLNLKKKKTI